MYNTIGAISTDYAPGATVALNRDTSFSAVWRKVSTKIIYDPRFTDDGGTTGGSGTMDADTIYFYHTNGKLVAGATHYWFTDAAGNGRHTIKANAFTHNKSTAVFKAPTASELQYSNGPASMQNVVTFKQWYVRNGDGNPVATSAAFDSFVSYSAQPKEYTLLADWDYGAITLPNPGSFFTDGFYFVGWGTAKDSEIQDASTVGISQTQAESTYGSGLIRAGSSSGSLPNNVTYYPHFVRRKFTLNFDYTTNGGYNPNSSDSSTVKREINYNYNVNTNTASGTSLALPTAEKSGDTGVYSSSNPDGWQFVGWALDPNETNTAKISKTAEAAIGFLSNGKMPAHDVTLYAIYKKVVTFTTVSHKYSGSDPDGAIVNKVPALGGGRIVTTSSQVVWNKSTSADFSFPTAGTVNGWNFSGWVRNYDAEFRDGVIDDCAAWLAKFKDQQNTHTDSGYPTKNSSATISHDTTFYAQYNRGITWYFVQTTVDVKGNGTIHRNSKSINDYVKTVTTKAPAIKNLYSWTSTKWLESMTANDESKGAYEQNKDMQAKDYGLYFANYEREITLTFDPTGHTAYEGGDVIGTQKGMAYLNVSGYDRTTKSAIPLHVYTKYALSDLKSRVYGSLIDSSVGENRSVIYPSFTMPAYPIWYRNAIKRETDVWQYCWTTEKTEDGKPDTHSHTTGKALTESHALGATISSYPEEFVKPYDYFAGNTYEFRENAIMYTVLYSKTAKDDDGDDGDDDEDSGVELIKKSYSLLVGETINIKKDFLTDEYSDAGRVYKVENLEIVKADQAGKVQGTGAGQTVIRVYTSDGQTLIGKCTITVSSASVTIPSEMVIGSTAKVGIKAASNGSEIEAKLTLESMSGLKGVYTGKVYQLYAQSSTDGGSTYSELKQGDVVVSATAKDAINESSVLFRVDPGIALESLQTDYYYSRLIWRLSVDKKE
ncbi:MAG: hypothetical protein ACI4A3_02015 [Lachnospiraceae bacterium]